MNRTNISVATTVVHVIDCVALNDKSNIIMSYSIFNKHLRNDYNYQYYQLY